jgi:DNA-binding NarL/FixJ family response regulator
VFDASWEEGRAWSFEQALAFALQGPATYSVTQEGPPSITHQASTQHQVASDLTEREIEVLRLVAEGLTNKEIAERLVLSHRTVQAHLYSIFSKLDVTTRSAATRAALERGLD